MRSDGLLLAAALALSDVISLAHGVGNKNEEPGPKASGTKHPPGTKPPTGTKPPSGKQPDDTIECFTLHLKASGTHQQKQVSLEGDVDLLYREAYPPEYATPVFPKGKGANVIWTVDKKRNVLAKHGKHDVTVLVTQIQNGKFYLHQLFLAPTDEVVPDLVAPVTATANIGTEGGFKVDGGDNLACLSKKGYWGYVFGDIKSGGMAAICIAATVTPNKAVCPTE